MAGAFVIREDGSRHSGASKDCSRCGHLRIEVKQATSPDFDQNGWYYVANFECLNIKCKHKWSEKVVVMTGGFTT